MDLAKAFRDAKKIASAVAEGVGAAKADGGSGSAPDPKDFVECGCIRGGGIPVGNDAYFWVAEDRLVAFQVKTGMFSSKNVAVKEVPFDQIAEFRHVSMTVKEDGEFSETDIRNEVILASGETLELRSRISAWAQALRQKEIDVWRGVFDIILNFGPLAKNDETKQWINGIFLACGADPAFEEDGSRSEDFYLRVTEAFANKVKELSRRPLM